MQEGSIFRFPAGLHRFSWAPGNVVILFSLWVAQHMSPQPKWVTKGEISMRWMKHEIPSNFHIKFINVTKSMWRFHPKFFEKTLAWIAFRIYIYIYVFAPHVRLRFAKFGWIVMGHEPKKYHVTFGERSCDIGTTNPCLRVRVDTCCFFAFSTWYVSRTLTCIQPPKFNDRIGFHSARKRRSHILYPHLRVEALKWHYWCFFFKGRKQLLKLFGQFSSAWRSKWNSICMKITFKIPWDLLQKIISETHPDYNIWFHA